MLDTLRARLSSRRVTSGLPLVGVLALALYHGGLLVEPPPEALAGAQDPAAIAGPFSLRLHGSTPTLAWSPDGARLAVAASFEYFGFGELPKQLASQTGIYVLDPVKRTSFRASSEQGFHPTWLDASTLFWGNSPYEHGAEGLYVARLKGTTATARRVSSLKGVYHVGLAAKRGRILLFSGYPEYRHWVEVDPRTGAFTPLGGVSAKGAKSWAPPAGARLSQCLQAVGVIRASVTAGGQYLLETKSQNVMIPGIPFSFFSYNGSGKSRSCDAGAQHCGPVAPCLSPKGDRLAYLTEGPSPGTFVVNVMVVPQ